MKKLILSIAITSVVALNGHAQQLLFQDNGNNSTDTTIGGVPNYSQDLNLELLVGSTSTTVTTDVVTLLLNGATASVTTALGSVQPAAGDITHSGGDIFDPSGNFYTVPAGTAWAQVLAWTGNYSTYAAAEASDQEDVYVGVSQIFALVPPPAAGQPDSDISNIEHVGGGNIDLTQLPLGNPPPPPMPEPSTLTLAWVGLVAMLTFRRKKK
jgi:hypothetical protein